MRVLEATSGAGSSPRQLNSSTDGEATKEQEAAVPVPTCPVLSPRVLGPESCAQAVPHAPLQEDDEAHGEEHHDADDFVPRTDRAQTLEADVQEHFVTKQETVTEVYEIGSDREEEGEEKAKAEGRRQRAVLYTAY